MNYSWIFFYKEETSMPSNDKDTIKIINSPAAMVKAGAAVESLPREGEEGPEAEEHAAWSFFTKKPVQDLAAEIDEPRGKIATIVTSLSKAVTQTTELSEVTIGLAVSINTLEVFL
jgi:hypothetical protein